MTAPTLQNKLLFSWKTSLVGLLSAIYAIAQPFINKDTTLGQLAHDQTFILALVGAAIGFLSKDATAHGTPQAPIPPVEAAKIAAVAEASPLPPSFVGAPVGASTLTYSALPGDPTPIGGTLKEARGTFTKISATLYEKTP